MRSLVSLFLLYLDASVDWIWPATRPESCLGRSSLTSLIDCLDRFTVPENAFDATSYALAQPTTEERGDWASAIISLLDGPPPGWANGTATDSCAHVTIPPSLRDVFRVASFTTVSFYGVMQYCALFESTLDATGTHYRRGWGTFVVPAHPDTCLGTSQSRAFHIAAPHPHFDEGTPQQAAALFESTGARSLLISGRHRAAYRHPTDCVIPANPKTMYWKTDPTHDWAEPFNTANFAIKAWQDAHGGCPTSSCAYVQMHGKADESCPTDSVFISSGLGRSSASLDWYEAHPELPARRLQDALRSVWPADNFSTPLESPCALAATGNVFGRLVNGVPEDEVCHTGATARTATGAFVHAEQAWPIIQNYGPWAEALKRAFPAIRG